ncbi:uncharacterized protein LOC117332587 [Pecten maximus]|uniref:uncharacterized protein LOC117332587 n=1 Tax=Pecten maximus TaxID=6579 RepID=UPI0014586FBA|nr:uncharacterized protein LOC117332587 [Pecten maximus]
MAAEGSSVDKYDVQSDLPSLEWELNLVLDDIAQEMTEDDVDRMKDFCSGEEGIPAGVLDKITSGRQFFKLLRRQCYLDRHNLLYLQAMLWNLGKQRRTLYKKLSEFAKRCELEPLNFFTYEETIIPGFQYVHFHVSGTDTSRRDIDRLQALVAKLVRAPLHLVHVSGVQPFRSIIITFRVPVDLVGALKQLTAEEKGLLQAEGIDSFFIDEEEIRIAHEKSDIPARLSERDEVIKLMNRNRKLEKEVESHLLDISEEEGKVDKLQDDLQKMNDTFRQVLIILMDGRKMQKPIDFENETILARKIKEFEIKYPRCSKQMQELLLIKGVVVQQAQISEWSNYINTMVTDCEVLYKQLHRDMYGPFSPLYSDPVDWQNEDLKSEPSTQGNVTDSFVSGEEAVLNELSMLLNDDDRSKFRGTVTLSAEEEETLKKSPQYFLGILLKKETLPAGKDKRQYLVEKLQASGMSDLEEHVTRCFDAATCQTTNEDDVAKLDLVHPSAMSTPTAGQPIFHRSFSDVFPKSSNASYKADDIYQTVVAFRDILPELLKQLPATDSLKHRTRMSTTIEVD